MRESLGNRMKTNYENVSKTKLVRRMPCLLRLDGRSFHTFTRSFRRPFDYLLMDCMQYTMKKLCENIQGVKLGYCQSDEISLLLTDYDNIDTSAWFDYEVQKLCSVSASMATLYFNTYFKEKVEEYAWEVNENWHIDEAQEKYVKALLKAEEMGAMFDSRCFNIPKEEVANYFLWRQQDATRNSIQMAGQYNFSHKQLQGKSCNEIQDMLFTEKGVNWNDYPTCAKRGTCCKKVDNKWELDKEIPIFKNEDRRYIEKLV